MPFKLTFFYVEPALLIRSYDTTRNDILGLKSCYTVLLHRSKYLCVCMFVARIFKIINIMANVMVIDKLIFFSTLSTYGDYPSVKNSML